MGTDLDRSLLVPTFLRRLADPALRTVLLCGCGGGFDFVHGLTLYPELRRLGKEVVIVSYSFGLPERIADHRRAEQCPDRLAILADISLLEPTIVPASGQEILEQPNTHFQVAGIGEFLEGLGDQLVGGIAEHFAGRRVHLQETTICAYQDHAERRVLERKSEGLFGSARFCYI